MYEHFHFRYSKLKEHSDGFTAILRIDVVDYPGVGSGLLFEGTHTLFGPVSKRDIAKYCSTRVKEPSLDWDSMLTRGARAVVDFVQEGSAIVDLSTGEVGEPNSPLLPPILKENEHTVLFGLGGTGKSSLMLSMGACLDQGVNYLADDFDALRQVRVLYLDWEDEQNNQTWRLEMLREGWSMAERPNILWKRCDVSLVSMADALARQILSQKVQYLMIDSAALACGAEPETADAANAFFRALRGLSRSGIVGSLIIAHQPKEKERSNMPFGSVFWWNNPRSIWQIQKAQEEGQDKLHVGLFHRKANNGPLERPIAFALEFDNKQIRIRSEAPKDVPDLREHLNANSQVVEAVREHVSVQRTGPTRDELRAALSSMKRGTFDSAYKRLLDSNKLTTINGRVWLVHREENSESF